MKKIISAFLCAALTLCFSACGQPTASTEEAGPASAVTTTLPAPRTHGADTESTPESSIESKPESKTESTPESKTESKTESKAESKPESKSESKIESKPVSSPESKAESKPESKSESKPTESKSESKPESTPESKAESSSAPKVVDLTEIGLSDQEIVMPVESTYQLGIQFFPYNATRYTYTWNWSNDNIISMDSNGTIHAKAVGTALITAKTYNGLTAECKVTVTEKPPEPVRPPEASSPVYHPDVPQPTGKTVAPAWFDDAVFVGDSVSMRLSYYAENGCLGDAEFLCGVGLGYNNALWDPEYRYSVHPVYNGKKRPVEESIRLTGKKKVFIMLGMNDIGGYGVDGTINGMKKLTDRILMKSPDVQIYIQSVTPLLSYISRDDMLNNANIALFNTKAQAVCKERGFIFVDVASAVDDGHGNLLYENCGDPDYMGLHFSAKGCERWVEYLYRHVA